MPIRFSFVGKGGTGKTTLSAILIDFLIHKNKVPILAVDADPNFNLNELLGIEVETTLSEVRESLLKSDVPDFISRYEYTEMKVHQILVENKYFDLLVMGYPETSGCYCPVHSFLSTALEKLMRAYSYIVIDNEAGMEHISRLNLTEMEHLI
jgi:CO dehydrogenase maturation factor